MMDLHRQEWTARVNFINAVARSQSALSRILESVADVAGQDVSKELAKKLCDNIQVMTDYQSALCRLAPGIQFNQRKKMGTPMKPWTNAAYIRTAYITRGVQEENRYGQDCKNQKKSSEEKRKIKKSETSFAQKEAQTSV